MKRILMLIILSVLLCSCFSLNPHKCIDYTGPKKCVRFHDGVEEVWGD